MLRSVRWQSQCQQFLSHCPCLPGFYIFTGSPCISDKNQGISYILSLKVSSIYLPFWIVNKLKLDFLFFLFCFFSSQCASEKTNSGLEKRKQTLTQAPVLHKVFSKIPSYAEVLGKHCLHWHVVNNCCHVFGEDRLVMTLGIEGFTGTRNLQYLLVLSLIYAPAQRNTRCNKVFNTGRVAAGRAVIWS